MTLNPAPFLLAMAVAVGLGLVCCVWFVLLAFGLRKRYSRLMAGQDGLKMEELLCRYGDLLEAGSRRQDEVESRLAKLEEDSHRVVAGLGLVRFNAFQETGGELSFSLALLNRSLDGAVITSIFGRDNNRVYGKPIRKGQSGHHLSEEEQDALREAGIAMRREGKGGSGSVTRAGKHPEGLFP